nr:glycosyltransferase 61 family protein [Acetobacter fallax]
MVDFLPKFHLLALAGISLKDVRILLPTNMGAFGRDLLRVMGLGDEQILRHDPDKEVLQCRTLIVPTAMRLSGRCHPMYADAVATINEMIDQTGLVPPSSLRRVYITRGAQFGRKLYGLEQAEDIAREQNFTVLRPELLSIPEQVSLFRGAREVVGSYGSALHSSIFSRPGLRVAAIHAQPPVAFDALQSGIGERLGQITGYIFGTSIPDDPSGVGFEAESFRACLTGQFSHPNLRRETIQSDTAELPNIASGRPAMQSSVSVWSTEPTPEREAARGVSGVVDGKNWFQTKLEDRPWWQVDLGSPFRLREIRVFNRMGTTEVMARVAALSIAVSLDGNSWRILMTPADHGVFGGNDGNALCWQADNFRDPKTDRKGRTAVAARWVRVFLESRDCLSLEQVEVYGVPVSDDTSSAPRLEGPLSGLLPDDAF